MDDDLFTQYVEQGLTFEQSFGQGGSTALKETEDIAWFLHEQGSAAGGIMLGDKLLSNRVSFSRRDIKAVPFARSLVEESFSALISMSDKGQWDWYYLGIAWLFGRGTKVDHKQATDCFRQAKELGNPYAEFEEIWSRYLDDGEMIEAALRFRRCEGKLERYAEASARALSLIALGPSRELGSYKHAWRIFEISQLLHVFLYHDIGSRRINVAVEAEMRTDVEQLESLQSASVALVLYLIAKRSRSNPTSRDAIDWLRGAVTPSSGESFSLLTRQHLNTDELVLVKDICRANQWENSKIARYVSSELELSDDEEGEENDVE